MSWPTNGPIEMREEGVNLLNYPNQPSNTDNIKVSTEDDKVRVDDGSLSFVGQAKQDKDYNYCLEYDDETNKMTIMPINNEYSLQQLENVDDFLDKELLDGFQDISDDDESSKQQSNTPATTSSNTQPMSLNAFLGSELVFV